MSGRRKGMKIRKWLWILAGILLVLILAERPRDEEQENIADGTYQNVYLRILEEEKMTVCVEGKMWTIPCPVGTEIKKEDQIVDISVENGTVTGIVWKEGEKRDKVEAIDSEAGWIRFQKMGLFSLAEQWKAYQAVEDSVREITETGSLILWDQVSFLVLDGKVEALVAGEEPEEKNIQVLLHGEEDEVYHQTVRLTASASYQVVTGGETTEYQAGEEFALEAETEDVQEKEESYQVVCPSGKIRLLSTKRSSGYPEYEGTLWIRKENGGYVVRNELSLESYLCSVVSSEMPSEYPKEALKAQAVCARTYALYQMNRSYYSAYGASVDDTVNSQVYNNVPETEESRAAVEETKEQYMEYQDQPIAAYFYSTSCGTTSDVNEVWIGEEEPIPYLTGHFQGEGKETVDLSSEKTFLEFLEEEQEDAFEKEEAWFRWETAFSLEQVKKNLEQNLASWIKTNPSYFLWNGEKVESDGKYDVGTVKDISVKERSTGGIIKKLQISGSGGTLTVIGEYQIRKVLCPENTEVTRKDGTLSSCTILPSAFFSLKTEENQVMLTGGGYGHGVGMSQNGAKAMANLDYTYEEILDFYYPSVTLVYGY
jgi:stage II sporulation protein D